MSNLDDFLLFNACEDAPEKNNALYEYVVAHREKGMKMVRSTIPATRMVGLYWI